MLRMLQVRLALEVVFEGAGGGAALDLGAIRGLQSDGNRILVCERVCPPSPPSSNRNAPLCDPFTPAGLVQAWACAAGLHARHR